MTKGIRQILCFFHSWSYHVRGLGVVGLPDTWQTCSICGKTLVTSICTETPTT